MNDNKTNKNGKKGILGNKFVVLGISFLIAIICWVAVVATVNTEHTTTIYNIPITMPSNPSYRNYGIEIVGTTLNETRVNITVRGDRSIVSSLGRDSFVVTPIFSNVDEAGTYDLTLQITQTNPLLSFEILQVSPANITLNFAEVESQNFTIQGRADGLTPAEGYLINTLSLSQSEVIISGPVTEIANIGLVTAEMGVTAVLSESVTETCALKVYDKEGAELETTNLTFSVNEVEVTAPVYKLGVLKLDIGFANVPEGFDIQTLEYSLSVSEIRVAANAATIDSMTTRTVGYIDLTMLDLNETYSFEVVLPTGMVNLDGVETITVSFPSQGLSSKRINVSDIRVENAPESVSYNIDTSRINNVTIIAHSGDIEKISNSSAVAVVDASALSSESGAYTVAVSILLPGFPSAWAVGSYTVVITVGN